MDGNDEGETCFSFHLLHIGSSGGGLAVSACNIVINYEYDASLFEAWLDWSGGFIEFHGHILWWPLWKALWKRVRR